jgi:putative transposase
MQLNDAGKMVYDVWSDLPAFYPGVQTDAFIVMPNHIHGIIILVGADPRVGPNADPRACPGQPQGVAPTLGLPDVVHRFKTMTTKRYADGVNDWGGNRFVVACGNAITTNTSFVTRNPSIAFGNTF